MHRYNNIFFTISSFTFLTSELTTILIVVLHDLWFQATSEKTVDIHQYINADKFSTSDRRREFFREMLYKNIAIIAIQHSNIYFVDTCGDFSHTVR